MKQDKIKEVLLEALKRAIAEPGEQRLFRSGKLAGLFAGRSGVNAEAATQALRDDLLQVVRTETRGKVSMDWVRPTPRAVHFVHDHESPIRVLEELRALLAANREAVPAWLAEIDREVKALVGRLGEEAQRWSHRLEALSQRVEESLRRAEARETHSGNGAVEGVSWTAEALAYLDRRRDGGGMGPCPFPELFAAVRQHHGDLSITAFHEGLRRLDDRRALNLLPFAGPASELPEPEYALLDGGTMLYYAARS
jgi:hypothetical protein